MQPNTKVETDNVKENNEIKSENVKVSKIDEPDNIEENKSIGDESPPQKVERDPRYDRYFKLIHLGAQKEEVKLRAQREGLDPSILDEPQQTSSRLKENVQDTTTSQD